MRKRGHELFFATAEGAQLAVRARAEGFPVREIPLVKPNWLSSLRHLNRVLLEFDVDLVNTHSSWDSWTGGLMSRCLGKKVLRTRHLSTPIKGGLNARLLYNWLVDYVVTTSTVAAERVASLSPVPCRCIATGISPEQLEVSEEEKSAFRKKYGIAEEEFIAGTLCIVRSWKGITDLLHAANLLRNEPNLRWVIVGGGWLEPGKKLLRELSLEEKVLFTGHLEAPAVALSAFDIFLLLSTAHEGISQASLQAAYLEKALITTRVGGLPEVCLDGKTGFLVPPHSAEQVAEKVLELKNNSPLRSRMGKEGKKLVLERFTREQMLDEMEKVYVGLFAERPTR